ncbi:HNH endonuclease [Burkholderia sp. 1B3(2022)]|uniref:HNH endonuclease n=1 Tax=Burkholderia sp. 1B3(2022) TaxID=2997425 RepID=UPI002FC95045
MSYTKAILQLIQENPGISADELDARLRLCGRDVCSIILPYIRRGDVVVKRIRSVEGRKVQRTFESTQDSFDASKYRPNKSWTDCDMQVLIEMYPTHPNSVIAQRLDRNDKQIECKARKLGLRKPAGYLPPPNKYFGPQTFWSDEQVHFLKEHYPNSTIETLSPILNKTYSQIAAKVRRLGIKKSASFRKKCGDRVEPLGTSTRLIGEPIGTEKMWGGCIYVKVDAKGSWQPKHAIIWRSHYGDYNGRSHCLWFIDRNPANCDITNLELITRKESANRTSIFQYPKDLREAIVLHNKLKRRIREQH